MSLILKVSSIVVLFSHPSLPGTPVGYPGVRIAPVVDWSGGFHGAFDGTVFQCCSPVGCETVGLDSGSISVTGLGEFCQSIGCRPIFIGVDLHRLHVACRAMKPAGFPPTAL